MAAKKKVDIQKVILWVLMGMLFVGLAGFGTTNFGGRIQTVGAVGDKEITVDRYVRALRQEMRAQEAQTGQPLTFQQARAQGLDQRVLAQLVTTRALDGEAAAMGLSVGDAEIARQLTQIGAFKGADGNFDRETYAFALRNIGMKEAAFEEDLRDESARTILQSAVLAGNAMPDIYIDTLVSYALETRDFSWVLLDRGALTTGLPVADDATLRAFYDANIDTYTSPETRDITFAWITPDMILGTVEVDEAALRDAYAERLADYIRPERRLVERLAYADDAAAEDAAARIRAGDSDFETEVTRRGLELSDTDMGDVTMAELDTAGDGVFAAEPGTVVGPLPTALGPALFRVNAVLPAQETSFEDAQADLRDDLALDRARRVIRDMNEPNEDMLAGGATLEDLAQETEMQLGRVDWFAGSDAGIAGYESFRALAASLSTDDYPEIQELEDGGLFAARLNGTTPPAPIPFDQVKDQVAAAWEARQMIDALQAQAKALTDGMTDGQTLADLGLAGITHESGRSRTDFLPGLPGTALQTVFGLKAGETALLPLPDAVAILQLDAIHAADTDSADAQYLVEALKGQAASALSQDLFTALTSDIQLRTGVQVDQQALNAVQSSMQ